MGASPRVEGTAGDAFGAGVGQRRPERCPAVTVVRGRWSAGLWFADRKQPELGPRGRQVGGGRGQHGCPGRPGAYSRGSITGDTPGSTARAAPIRKPGSSSVSRRGNGETNGARTQGAGPVSP